MTSFLRLNGIAVPVAAGSASMPTPRDIGGRHEDVTGAPIYNRRGTKFSWAGATVIRTSAEVLAWRDLVLGRGCVINWDLNNQYSSKGNAPSLIEAGFTISATLPKFGAFRAASAATATNRGQWPLFTSTSPWTICVWDTTDGGTTWHHYVVNSLAQKWVDGVRNDGATTTFMGVTGGLVTLGINSVAHGFDDFVAFPQVMPTGWPPQVYAFGAAFGLLPQLKADGLFIEQNSVINVKGQAGNIKPHQGGLGGVFSPTLSTFDFTLEQA